MAGNGPNGAFFVPGFRGGRIVCGREAAVHVQGESLKTVVPFPNGFQLPASATNAENDAP